MKILIDMNLSPDWVKVLKLDFGVLLALTQAESPSVIQVRTQDIFPEVLGDRLVKVLQEHQSVLEKGALLTVDEGKSRVRILPFE